MKLTIKEIKEKCETDDKVNFKGIVDKVWDFNEKESKYSIGYQNIIIKDDTDKIKVIFSSIKTKADIYPTSIEGKEVEASGKVTIYNGETNVFGKLVFKEDQETKPGVSQSPQALLSVAGGITTEEIRLKCIAYSLEMYKETNLEIIQMAKIFEKYVCQGTATAIKGKVNQPEPELKSEEQGTDSGNGDKMSPEKVKQINQLMALAENRGSEGKEYINDLTTLKGYKSVKEFLDEDIKEATNKLKNIGTEEIPF